MEELLRSGKTSVFKYCILTVLGLICLKMVVGIRSASLGVLSSAVDSFLDLFSSLVNWFSLVQSQKPADAEHQYGHGKIESLAGFFQSIVLSLTACYLIFEAYQRYQSGMVQVRATEAILAMLISLLATFFLVWKLKKAAKETDSIILRAEALHFETDFISGLGVIFSLIIVGWTGRTEFDFAAGILIAIYILKHSLHLLKTSLDELIDRALPPEEVKEIKKAILSYDSKICDFHDFRTRKMGPVRFIEFHIEIREVTDFVEAHDLTESLICDLQEKFPLSDITIHYDPEGAE